MYAREADQSLETFRMDSTAHVGGEKQTFWMFNSQVRFLFSWVKFWCLSIILSYVGFQIGTFTDEEEAVNAMYRTIEDIMSND